MEKNKQYIAHIKNDGAVQPVKEHCEAVAKIAKSDLQNIGLGDTAYLAGILHDTGKYTEEFNEYILKSEAGEKAAKGSVIHTFAGVYYILTKMHEGSPVEKLTAELIAYAIGAHHGNFDLVSVEMGKENGFTHRLARQPEYEKKAIKNMEAATEYEAQTIFKKACEEVKNLYGVIREMSTNNGAIDKTEAHFYLGCAARLLLSSLMDGDRKDTAAFMKGTDFSSLKVGTPELWGKVKWNILALLNSFQKDTRINSARREISDFCEAFATEEPGIYKLNVPTGGGKTLSALRCAVLHAEKFNKKRIIYTAPMISIIDQNADVIREAVGEEVTTLEHHSNIVHPKESTRDELQRYELLAETWDSPVIITTMAQLLNALFSRKASSIRRMQSLCESVIIIDEIQQAPKNLLHLINLAINFISIVCRATVIICSATQPTLDKMKHSMKVSDKAIISTEDFERFQKIFKRTKLIDAGGCKTEDLPDLVANLSSGKSTLLICNTKAIARKTFRALKERNKGKEDFIFHLSASMCPKHRRRVISNIKDALKEEKKVICIATQVVEAGVDLSFEVVIRLAAGIDNIIQAAGRCNRNGENEGLSDVYIVRCEDECLGDLKEIKYAKKATLHLLSKFEESPEEFDNDIGSEKAITWYYEKLSEVIKRQEGEKYFNLKTDKYAEDMLSFLSEGPDPQKRRGNEDYDRYMLHQAFKTAGDEFEVFDSKSAGKTVIVPYIDEADEEDKKLHKAERIIAELNSNKAKYEVRYAEKLLKEAKEYTVNIYDNEFQKLLKQGVINLILDGTVAVLREEWYGAEGLLEKEDLKQ